MKKYIVLIILTCITWKVDLLLNDNLYGTHNDLPLCVYTEAGAKLVAEKANNNLKNYHPNDWNRNYRYIASPCGDLQS